MAALGFSVNSLTLFGLVLAVGIVVDDAIVVVENVERHLAAGLAAREAAIRTMDEVGGALVSIALVLCAVFVPTAFLPGITGEFFRQFAVTIAVATVISAFNSLTLSPALASLILEPHHQPGLGSRASECPQAAAAVVVRRLQWLVRPGGARLRGRRARADAVLSGHARHLRGPDRRDALAGAGHTAWIHSAAGSRLSDRIGAASGRRIARAHHRGAAPGRGSRSEHPGGGARAGVRRVLGLHAYDLCECGCAVPGVRAL